MMDVNPKADFSSSPRSSRPAVFLDRDGVIIENRSDYVRSWDDVAFYEQALEALRLMRALPCAIVIVTNQSAVGRGIISLAQAEAINRRVVEHIRSQGGRVDAAYLCPHAPGTGSPCRKPQPGMLLQAARDLNLDLSRSWMVGDALTDVQAGQAAGVAQSVLVRTGRGATQLSLPEAARLGAFRVVDDLLALVPYLKF
ncbi:MAG TPA: HAD family hydrolase [Chloroflexi bacterium]|nr:HAD family hydrolase [Chloroflexota bacterium]